MGSLGLAAFVNGTVNPATGAVQDTMRSHADPTLNFTPARITLRTAVWPLLLISAFSFGIVPASLGVDSSEPTADVRAAIDARIHELLRSAMRKGMAGDYEGGLAIAKEVAAIDPRHPGAPFIDAQMYFWMFAHDGLEERFDDPIEHSCQRVIDLANARIEANSKDALGYFFLGQGQSGFGRLRGFRGRYYEAGKAGEKSRVAFERVLELQPQMVDAKYQLGALYFFASLIPQPVTKYFSWLWFIPIANAELGLEYLQAVEVGGDLFRDDSIFLLANLYTYFRTERLPDAVAMLRGLRARYPDARPGNQAREGRVPDRSAQHGAGLAGPGRAPPRPRRAGPRITGAPRGQATEPTTLGTGVDRPHAGPDLRCPGSAERGAGPVPPCARLRRGIQQREGEQARGGRHREPL